jgi:hypothetical protein
VTPLLLGEPLLQGLEQLVPAERLDLGLLRFGEVLLDELAQPFLRDRRRRDRLAHALQALEDRAEDPVESVEMTLVLHERGACQEVELLDALLREVALEGVEQDEVLAQGDGHLGVAERGEEVQQHGGITRSRRRRVKRAAESPGARPESIRVQESCA